MVLLLVSLRMLLRCVSSGIVAIKGIVVISEERREGGGGREGVWDRKREGRGGVPAYTQYQHTLTKSQMCCLEYLKPLIGQVSALHSNPFPL